MQTLDLNTNTQPISIVRIEVEKLFGRYDYVLEKKDIYGVNSSLIILYGDNGSGKTTILKLLFHLLSPSQSRGHRTFLANTPFSKFTVFLADGINILIKRNNDNITGSFCLQILDNKQKLHKNNENDFIYDVVVNTDSDNSAKNREEREKVDLFYRYFYKEFQLRLFFLGDDRVLNSDIFEFEDIDDDRIFRSLRLSKIGNPSENILRINREFVMRTSINRTENWIREQALRGTNQGSANVHNLYEEIIARILASSGELVEGELFQSPDKLINELREIEKRSENFYRFGLMSNLDNKKIISVLNSKEQENYSIVSRVLQPYINSLSARFDAFQDTLDLLTIFENTINNLFFRDKKIKLHVREGIKIFTNDGKELAPEILSSGEKQLLLLFCNTLTARDQATIFIIDEPEISLNIKWQRQLIRSLLELTKGSQVQFILATHSIELLTQYKHHVIKLMNVEK